MEIYIYKLIDPRTNHIKYVGKTNKPKVRLKTHCSRRWNTACSKWIKGLLEYGYRPRMEIIEVVSEAVWHEREQYWIAYYRAQGEPLENTATWQAPGNKFGHEVSPMTREQLSKAFKGRTIPPEQRAQISKTLTGKEQSPESIAKRQATIRANRPEGWKRKTPSELKEAARIREGKPKKFSPEWKAKIAVSLKARYELLSLEEQERIKANGHLAIGKRKNFVRAPYTEEQKQQQSLRLKAYLATLTPEERAARMKPAQDARRVP